MGYPPSVSKTEPLPSIKEAFENFATALINVTRQTHAGFVLALVAVLDHDLERCLKAAMRPLNREMRDRLFTGYGPLNSLAAKIDLSFALGILDSDGHAEFLKV